MVYREKIINWYTKYERHISSGALILGFIVDNLTLRRVDLLAENILIIVYLAVAGTGIIFLNLNENGKFKENISAKVHFWALILTQFSFGGLFSSFLVFYFRSASVVHSWPFFVLLIGVFLGNEIFKKQYSRLAFQISVLFLSIYFFAIFAVPVLLRKIGDGIFLLSGAVSLIILGLFLLLLWKIAGERFIRSKKIISFCVGGIYVLMNFLYFANIIPPIPLSLKDVGVYHYFVGDDHGNYKVMSETKKWHDYFRVFEIFHRYGGEPVYVYSAVFSPTNLNTDIFHQWKYFDEKKARWVDSSKIEVPIVGGNEGGYKMYSEKVNLFPALWRVDVLTTTGQLLGQIKFRIVDVKTPVELIAENK